MAEHVANWKLIKQIAIDYTSNKSNKIISLNDIERIFSKMHPDRNLANVSMDTRLLTVDSQSRLSYLRIFGRPSADKKVRNSHLKNSASEYPRISSEKNEKDFFVYKGNSMFEIYDSSKHGVWIIRLDASDTNHIEKLE